MMTHIRRWWCRRRHRGVRYLQCPAGVWSERGYLYAICGVCPRLLENEDLVARQQRGDWQETGDPAWWTHV